MSGHSTFSDKEGTRRTAEFSVQLRFSGIIIDNPRRAPIANEVFSPPPEDIVWANKVVTMFDGANATEERTAVVVDGEMIDGPFVTNARQILERHALIEQVERERLKNAPSRAADQ